MWPTADLSDTDYLTTISVYEHGVFYGMRATIPRMIAAGGGAIVTSPLPPASRRCPPCPTLPIRPRSSRYGYDEGGRGRVRRGGVSVNSVHPGRRAAADDGGAGRRYSSYFRIGTPHRRQTARALIREAEGVHG